MNLKITIINCTMINFTQDIWNHMTGFGRSVQVFEVIWWKLAVPLSWWISCLIDMKGIELVHMYLKTWWEEVRATYDAGISLVYNFPTKFSNCLLYDTGKYNTRIKSLCIIVGERLMTQMIRVLDWSGQGSCCLNHL